MIIEAPYKQNDTITIKTSGGEEVVARFIQEDDKTITIQKPLSLVASGQGMGLAPFAYTIDQDAKLKLNKSTVLFAHKTQADMAKQYTTSSTGIQMA
jgi:hypothetical protein